MFGGMSFEEGKGRRRNAWEVGLWRERGKN